MPPLEHQIIRIHLDAPAKPALGQPCNGCGVCCLAEPCPIGQLISRRRLGACTALRWSEADRRYLCGVVASPKALWPWLPQGAARLLGRAARRWIAAAQGCDSSLEVPPRPN